jgi:hypothetical protein
MRVLVSRDGRWRVEFRDDGWYLWLLGGPILLRATLDQVVGRLLDEGVDPAKDLVED